MVPSSAAIQQKQQAAQPLSFSVHYQPDHHQLPAQSHPFYSYNPAYHQQQQPSNIPHYHYQGSPPRHSIQQPPHMAPQPSHLFSQSFHVHPTYAAPRASDIGAPALGAANVPFMFSIGPSPTSIPPQPLPHILTSKDAVTKPQLYDLQHNQRLPDQQQQQQQPTQPTNISSSVVPDMFTMKFQPARNPRIPLGVSPPDNGSVAEKVDVAVGTSMSQKDSPTIVLGNRVAWKETEKPAEKRDTGVSAKSVGKERGPSLSVVSSSKESHQRSQPEDANTKGGITDHPPVNSIKATASIINDQLTQSKDEREMSKLYKEHDVVKKANEGNEGSAHIKNAFKGDRVSISTLNNQKGVAPSTKATAKTNTGKENTPNIVYKKRHHRQTQHPPDFVVRKVESDDIYKSSTSPSKQQILAHGVKHVDGVATSAKRGVSHSPRPLDKNGSFDETNATTAQHHHQTHQFYKFSTSSHTSRHSVLGHQSQRSQRINTGRSSLLRSMSATSVKKEEVAIQKFEAKKAEIRRYIRMIKAQYGPRPPMDGSLSPRALSPTGRSSFGFPLPRSPFPVSTIYMKPPGAV
jgi:hypothetical protein